jgi:hypothetical protein
MIRHCDPPAGGEAILSITWIKNCANNAINVTILLSVILALLPKGK